MAQIRYEKGSEILLPTRLEIGRASITLVEAVKQAEEQSILVREVDIDRTVGNTRGTRDLFDRRAVKSARRKDGRGSIQDLGSPCIRQGCVRLIM